MRYQIFRLIQVIASFVVIGLVSRELPSNSINIWLLMGTIINLGNYVDLGISGVAIDSVKDANAESEQIKNAIFWNSILSNQKKLLMPIIFSSFIALYFYEEVALHSQRNTLLSLLVIWIVSILAIVSSILSSYFVAMGTSRLFTLYSLKGVLIQLFLAFAFSLNNFDILTFVTLLAVPNAYILGIAIRSNRKLSSNHLRRGETRSSKKPKITRKFIAIQFQTLQTLIMMSSLTFPVFISNSYPINDSNSYQVLSRIAFLAASVSGIHLPNLWTSSTVNESRRRVSNTFNQKGLIIERLLIPTLIFLSIPGLYIFNILPKSKYEVPSIEETTLWMLISIIQYHLAKFHYKCLADDRLKALFLPSAIPLLLISCLVVLALPLTIPPVVLVFSSQIMQLSSFMLIWVMTNRR